MEFILAIVIRGGLGLIFGILLGIGGLFFGFAVLPGLTPPMWALVLLSGTGASVAGFLAWLKPEATWRVIAIGLLLAVIGGIVGAWVGFWYGEMAYPEGVRNVRLVSTPNLKSPAVFTFINGAAIFSTLLGALYYSFRLWRYHEA